MKTLMHAAGIRLVLATVAAAAVLATAARADENGIVWENCTPLDLFTNPQQFPPKPVPYWNQHPWEREMPDWMTATNAWRESAINPAQHLPNPLPPEGLPAEDTFLPFDVPNPPAWPDSDLGVPGRPDQIYGQNQGYENDHLGWGRELPPAPPTEVSIPGVPFMPHPQYGVAPPQEKPVDWGGLFGGVADSLKEKTSNLAQPRQGNYTTPFFR